MEPWDRHDLATFSYKIVFRFVSWSRPRRRRKDRTSSPPPPCSTVAQGEDNRAEDRSLQQTGCDSLRLEDIGADLVWITSGEAAAGTVLY